MKKIFLFAFAVFGSFLGFGQDDESTNGYNFEVVIQHDATPVKSQDITGTCWSFSTVSFVESELLRTGKGEHNISEMFNVRKIYNEKSYNYMRRQGTAQFSQGSLAHDVMNSIKRYGMMPEAAYSGRENPDIRYDHREMVKMLKAVLDVALESTAISNEWDDVFEGILDVYMGEIPEDFEYNGTTYTPELFADEMGINPDEYVSLTSFTHHPFYSEFVLEIPDNFSNGSFYNLPLDEFISVLDNALEEGFTVAWDADVSEKTFSSKHGLALWPAKDADEMTSDEFDLLFKEISEEKDVNQKERQEAFEDHSTTDDHLMHITGLVKDQAGNQYYLVKNSWGTKPGFDGYFYASVPYARMKSIAILVHKDALPKDIKKKLGL